MNRARPIPGTIGLIFGGLWALLGAVALPTAWRTPGIAAAAAVTLQLVLALWRRAPEARRRLFGRRAYQIAVVLEVVAIMAANAVMPRYGLEDYFLQAVGVIVGLHFIGLWKATGDRRFVGIAGAMCVVSIVAAALPEPSRNVATGFGNALVLWIGASLRRA